MANVIFDCSQFVSFDCGQNPFDLDKAERIFTEKGFVLRTNSGIDSKKRLYFSDVFGEITMEIIDLEFLGNFEDWSDKSNPPMLVQRFIDAITELESTFDLLGLKIIFVDSANEDPKTNFVVNRKMESNDLRDELIYASDTNYDLYGNVYIFSR